MVYVDYDNDDDDMEEVDVPRKVTVFKHVCFFQTLSTTNN
jgi:hypothetical protein